MRARMHNTKAQQWHSQQAPCVVHLEESLFILERYLFELQSMVKNIIICHSVKEMKVVDHYLWFYYISEGNDTVYCTAFICSLLLQWR